MRENTREDIDAASGSKVFEIWSEGFAATGQSGPAALLATVEASSFREACDKHLENSPNYDAAAGTHWGCHLFDNEADARKSFG